ncbi:CinA family protein [Alphaproteobacteria bacterium]|nr:CinA family protein [Alphaproteobacteria bacterium]
MWKIINKQSEILLNQCLEKKLIVTTAESCTGGMIASSIVSISGTSAIFKSSVVTYSNDMKSKILNIPLKLINKNGAVSNIIAYNMASNVLNLMNADISIAVTGIAGPSGGSKNKPVGLVYIGIGTKKNIITKEYLFKGNRLKIRQETTLEALKLSNEIIKSF